MKFGSGRSQYISRLCRLGIHVTYRCKLRLVTSKQIASCNMKTHQIPCVWQLSSFLLSLASPSKHNASMVLLYKPFLKGKVRTIEMLVWSANILVWSENCQGFDTFQLVLFTWWTTPWLCDPQFPTPTLRANNKPLQQSKFQILSYFVTTRASVEGGEIC